MLIFLAGLFAFFGLPVSPWVLATIAVPVVLAVLYRRHLQRRVTYFAKLGVPTPPVQSLFLGHLPELCANNKNHERLLEWQGQLGKTYGIYEGAHRVIVTSDLAVVQEVLVKKFPIFHSRKLAPWFALRQANNERLNLFLSEGNQWKRLRALVSSTLTVSKIKALDPLMNQVFSELVQHFDAKSQCEGGEFDVKKDLMEAGFAFIARSAVGIYEPWGESSFLDDFIRIFGGGDDLKSLSNRFYAGTYDFLPVTQYINLAQFLLEIGGIISIRNKIENVIRKREIESSEEKSARHPDFIDFLRESQGSSNEIDDSEKQLFDHKVVKKLTREEVIACGMMFLVAGSDTTANTITLCLYTLAQHPEWQSRLLEEIEDVLGDKEPNYVDLYSMSTLDRFVREVNRLYPVGTTTVARRAVQDTTITDSQGHSMRVEKGTCVHVNVYAMHLDTELWGPDAACFDPDRFLEPNVRNSAAFLAFGSGLRMCPGMKLALHEVKLALVHLLRRFQFKLSPKTKLDLRHRTLMGPDSMILKVTSRVH